MIVTVWRHGQAMQAVSDEMRELSGQGADDISYGAHCLRHHLVERALPDPDQILYSRWRRTTQTAEIISAAFSHTPSVEETALIPGATVHDVDETLNGHFSRPAPPGHLILVSHQPLVSRLVDHYTGEPDYAPGLPPGGLVVLDMDQAGRGSARLLFWALPPEYEACL